VFIATISLFFAVMSIAQIPTLWSLGLLDPERIMQGFAAFLVLFLGMPVGERLASRVSAKTFDRAMLALLAVISLRLIWEAIA
jgi:uncharacterized membrane protein YfcA